MPTRRGGLILVRIASGFLSGCGPLTDVSHQVLDVDHAARVIEGFLINRHTRMTALLEKLHNPAQTAADFDGIDIRTRDHDVVHAQFPKTQNISEQHPLFRRESRVAAALPRQFVFEVFAETTSGPAYTESPS